MLDIVVLFLFLLPISVLTCVTRIQSLSYNGRTSPSIAKSMRDLLFQISTSFGFDIMYLYYIYSRLHLIGPLLIAFSMLVISKVISIQALYQNRYSRSPVIPYVMINTIVKYVYSGHLSYLKFPILVFILSWALVISLQLCIYYGKRVSSRILLVDSGSSISRDTSYFRIKVGSTGNSGRESDVSLIRNQNLDIISSSQCKEHSRDLAWYQMIYIPYWQNGIVGFTNSSNQLIISFYDDILSKLQLSNVESSPDSDLVQTFLQRINGTIIIEPRYDSNSTVFWLIALVILVVFINSSSIVNQLSMLLSLN